MGWLRKLTARSGAIALLLALQWAGAAPAWAQQKILVGIYQNPPKIQYQGAGRPEGIFIDVLESVARAEGWTPQYVPGTFAEGLERLARGEIDLMADVAATPARHAIYDFHAEPVLQSWSQVYARRDSGIRSILDLSGKRVAVLRGSVQQDFFLQLAGGFGVRAEVVPHADYAAAFRAVAAGEADAVVTNPHFGARHARAAGLEDTAVVFAPSGAFFAARKGAPPQVLAGIDRVLVAQKKDPRSAYFASLGRWAPRQAPAPLPGWVKWAAAAAALALLAGAAWAWTLRRAAARLRDAEARQRTLNEELSRIFDHSLDVVCVLDRDLRFSRVSRASATLWGHAPQELVGRPYLDLVLEPDRTAVAAELEKIQRGTPSPALQCRSLRKDGTVAWLVTSGVWSDSRHEMYCIARDDTERRQLLASVQAHTEQLQRANDDLRTFSRSVSHDLRAPLSVIAAFVAKVLEDGGHVLDARSVSLLQRVQGAADRMDHLIDDLLRLANVTEGALHRRRVDLGAMAHEVLESLRGAEPQRPVRVAIEPDLWLDADPRLLRVALENLLGNAWKFTSRTPEAAITIGREAGADADVFYVRDNGAGFEMAYADKLFTPFQRLHDRGEFEGTGIGLSIVHRVVCRHGGRIWAEATPGEGALFRFTLD